jgi:hypothetical protein
MKQIYIIITLVLITLAYFLGRSNGKAVYYKTETLVDTQYIVKTQEPVVIEKVKTKIKYLRDTMIVTKPFEAKLDTVLRNDTISLSYIYPTNEFSMRYSKKADTALLVNIKTRESQIIREEEAWWKAPLLYISGFVSAVIINGLFK